MGQSILQWRVAVDGEETDALFEPATSRSREAVFVCAHGAGGDMGDRGMAKLAPVLRAAGFDLVRFNFLYREEGSRRPDPMPRLKACMKAVVSRVRAEVSPRSVTLGGRSMGGRVASMLAAESRTICDALLLLAYPLHPAGQPDRLRDAHLPQIQIPVLCFNGTRDALCRRELMERALESVVAPWQMHWLDGADHSFHVLKSSGRTDGQVLYEIGEISAGWLTRLHGEILAGPK